MYYCIGSCRINNPLLSKKIKNLEFHLPEYYTHSTKETIQILNFLLKKNNLQIYKKEFNNKIEFSENDVLFIEICSKKVFYYEENNNKIYLNNSQYNDIDSDNKHEYMQSDEEIISDLNEITNMVNCKIIFIGTLVPPIDENIILHIDWLYKLYSYRNSINILLENYCKLNKSIYCNINKLFDNYTIEQLLKTKEGNIKIDFHHFNDEMFEKVCDFYLSHID